MSTAFETAVKVAVYRHFADHATRPSAQDIANTMRSTVPEVRAAFTRLRELRVLFLEADGETILMASPFSGVPTQHRVLANGRQYYANCGWDALGIVAALGVPARVLSECAQSGEELIIDVDRNGPTASSWVFHCLVPAAKWWADLVYT